ncbi:MAG: type I-A CRISPR-associated protein Cas4/Csa1 [Bacillota bacterium]
MYFFSDEERKYLLRGLLPRARAAGVAEELRGWNWHQPPLEPVFDVRLAMYEAAGKYCPTGRDLYLRRVLKHRLEPNRAMAAGTIYHQTVARVITAAKSLIYQLGLADIDQLFARLRQPDLAHVQVVPDAAEHEPRCRAIWDFEAARIIARIQEILAKQPYIGEDALVALAVPVVVEYKMDGTLLGLSRTLSTDACMLAEPVVTYLKFGQRHDFHRLTTAGYALVMESVFEHPVNLGCVVYCQFKGHRLLIERDFHIIDDELRQWFIEERDTKARMLFEEADPGRSENCSGQCPGYQLCMGDN